MARTRTLITPKLEAVIGSYWSSVDPLIVEIDADIAQRGWKDMQISFEQVMFHRWLCRLANVRTVLEIGTYLGISAASFAAELPHDGHLDTVEIDADRATIAENWLRKGGLDRKVTVHRGWASEVLRRLPGPYDLCFIDGAKRQNVSMMQCCLERTRPGGLIVVDNVFYAGMIVGEITNPDAVGALEALAYARECPSLDPVVLPIADGLLICRVLRPTDIRLGSKHGGGQSLTSRVDHP